MWATGDGDGNGKLMAKIGEMRLVSKYQCRVAQLYNSRYRVCQDSVAAAAAAPAAVSDEVLCATGTS